jgi:hypothetical protein
LITHDKRAAVLRYLDEKKLGRKKEAQSAELELSRSAKDAAWAAVGLAKEASLRANLAIIIASVARYGNPTPRTRSAK